MEGITEEAMVEAMVEVRRIGSSTEVGGWKSGRGGGTTYVKF